MLITKYKNIRKYLFWRNSRLQCLNNKRKAICLVEKYFERNSYTAVQEAFRQRYNRAPPCKKAIQQNLKNTVHMESAWLETKFWKAKDCSFWRECWTGNNPRKNSARRNGMRSAVTFNRINREELRWFSYRVKVRQQLIKWFWTSFGFQLLVSLAI